MRRKIIAGVTGAVLAIAAIGPANAAEREQVRAVINLISTIKMPYPEGHGRNLAHTEYVRLGPIGEIVACLRADDKVRWCFEHIPPLGSRVEALRIRNEPADGISAGQTYTYIADYDLDGQVDLGSTTRLDPPPHAPAALVPQFYHRGANRGDSFRSDYQRLFDEGVQVALQRLGE
jgi:hypothetical protein